MSFNRSRTVVCVPTYRRVPQLVELLRALGAQTGTEPFRIVVGNNDVEDIAGNPLLSAPALPPRETIDVALRGVSAVRNAMIAHVLQNDDFVEWIACIDDDQVPEPDWLAQLLAVGVREKADLVGGPVSRLPIAQTFWSRGASDTSYLPTEEGATDLLNEAGNLLLSVAFLRSLDRPPFLLDFGRTGGEDYEFFLFARSRHARFGWAPRARVREVLPAGHLTFRGFMWRFYSIAAYQARADQRYRGRLPVLATVLWQAFKSPASLLRSVLRDRDLRVAVHIPLRSLAMLAGSLAGLAGIRADRYGARTATSVPKRG